MKISDFYGESFRSKHHGEGVTDIAHEAGTIVYSYSACDAFYDGKHMESI